MTEISNLGDWRIAVPLRVAITKWKSGMKQRVTAPLLDAWYLKFWLDFM